jgi:hypothetical protein
LDFAVVEIRFISANRHNVVILGAASSACLPQAGGPKDLNRKFVSVQTS